MFDTELTGSNILSPIIVIFLLSRVTPEAWEFLGQYLFPCIIMIIVDAILYIPSALVAVVLAIGAGSRSLTLLVGHCILRSIAYFVYYVFAPAYDSVQPYYRAVRQVLLWVSWPIRYLCKTRRVRRPFAEMWPAWMSVDPTWVPEPVNLWGWNKYGPPPCCDHLNPLCANPNCWPNPDGFPSPVISYRWLPTTRYCRDLPLIGGWGEERVWFPTWDEAEDAFELASGWRQRDQQERPELYPSDEQLQIAADERLARQMAEEERVEEGRRLAFEMEMERRSVEAAMKIQKEQEEEEERLRKIRERESKPVRVSRPAITHIRKPWTGVNPPRHPSNLRQVTSRNDETEPELVFLPRRLDKGKGRAPAPVDPQDDGEVEAPASAAGKTRTMDNEVDNGSDLLSYEDTYAEEQHVAPVPVPPTTTTVTRLPSVPTSTGEWSRFGRRATPLDASQIEIRKGRMVPVLPSITQVLSSQHRDGEGESSTSTRSAMKAAHGGTSVQAAREVHFDIPSTPVAEASTSGSASVPQQQATSVSVDNVSRNKKRSLEDTEETGRNVRPSTDRAPSSPLPSPVQATAPTLAVSQPAWTSAPTLPSPSPVTAPASLPQPMDTQQAYGHATPFFIPDTPPQQSTQSRLESDWAGNSISSIESLTRLITPSRPDQALVPKPEVVIAPFGGVPSVSAQPMYDSDDSMEIDQDLYPGTFSLQCFGPVGMSPDTGMGMGMGLERDWSMEEPVTAGKVTGMDTVMHMELDLPFDGMLEISMDDGTRTWNEPRQDQGWASAQNGFNTYQQSGEQPMQTDVAVPQIPTSAFPTQPGSWGLNQSTGFNTTTSFNPAFPLPSVPPSLTFANSDSTPFQTPQPCDVEVDCAMISQPQYPVSQGAPHWNGDNRVAIPPPRPLTFAEEVGMMHQDSIPQPLSGSVATSSADYPLVHAPTHHEDIPTVHPSISETLKTCNDTTAVINLEMNQVMFEEMGPTYSVPTPTPAPAASAGSMPPPPPPLLADLTKTYTPPAVYPSDTSAEVHPQPPYMPPVVVPNDERLERPDEEVKKVKTQNGKLSRVVTEEEEESHLNGEGSIPHVKADPNGLARFFAEVEKAKSQAVKTPQELAAEQFERNKGRWANRQAGIAGPSVRPQRRRK